MIGARAIAVDLNAKGFRTKYGKPWSAQSVLVVLRNRVYLGEVYFRGTWYKADHHHPAIIDAATFEQAEQIMIARGEDHAKRAFGHSDYLWAGHILCTHCQKRYVGAAAHGRLYRYRYYTCFTAHRYGSDACNAPRRRADQLEPALLQAMIDTYQRTNLVEEAVASAAGSNELDREKIESDLQTAFAELSSVDGKIDRTWPRSKTASSPASSAASASTSSQSRQPSCAPSATSCKTPYSTHQPSRHPQTWRFFASTSPRPCGSATQHKSNS